MRSLPKNTYRHDDFVGMPGAKGKGKAAPAKAPCELGGKIGGV